MELSSGALLLTEPTLDQIAITMALRSQYAGLVASDGNCYTVRKNNHYMWETHHQEPTIYRAYDRCAKRCAKLNRHLESDTPHWRPMIWVHPDAEPIQELLKQYLHQWSLIPAGGNNGESVSYEKSEV